MVETKYFSMICNNKNRTNSNSIPLLFNKTFNPIREIDDLSKYDLYLNSIIISNIEIPYRNFYNDISYDSSNFLTNKTNLSVSFYDPINYNFNLNGNTNTLLNGIDESPTNPGFYHGVSCFVSFYSENSNLPNPGDVNFISSLSYPRSYFNCHSLQHFLDMVNNACNNCISKNIALITPTMQFYYDPATLLYNLEMGNTIVSSTIDFYMNSFLQHMLDGFRTIYLSTTDILNEVPYRGMSYKLVKSTRQSAQNIYTAEYSTINNLSDVLSVVIYTDGGSLSCARSQIFCDVNDTNSYLTEKRILKILDFVFDSGSMNNNSIIQFENIIMDKPINLMSVDQLNNIRLSFYLLTTSNEEHVMNLNSSGCCMVKFTLKSKI
jgi:hypothetical protein